MTNNLHTSATTDHLASALDLAPLIERVHGAGHPELTRVRELTQALAAATDPATIGAHFEELRSVTHHYTLPSDACEAYTSTFEALRAADEEHTRRGA